MHLGLMDTGQQGLDRIMTLGRKVQASSTVIGTSFLGFRMLAEREYCLHISILECVQCVPDSMDLSTLSGTVNYSATEEFQNMLWNLKIQYRVHNNSQLEPVLTQMNPVNAAIFHFS
jgi:hypothetical protein